MPKTKTQKQKDAGKNRVELHFTNAENKKIESKVKAYNKKNGTDITRKEYLQNICNNDAKK